MNFNFSDILLHLSVVHPNSFLLYSPMMALNVDETCSFWYHYSVCCVDGLLVGFIGLWTQRRWIAFEIKHVYVCIN